MILLLPIRLPQLLPVPSVTSPIPIDIRLRSHGMKPTSVLYSFMVGTWVMTNTWASGKLCLSDSGIKVIRAILRRFVGTRGNQTLCSTPGNITGVRIAPSSMEPALKPGWKICPPNTLLVWSDIVWATLYARSEEHTSELQSQSNLVCRLLLAKKKH